MTSRRRQRSWTPWTTRDDGAIDRTLTDVLARAACDGPALLALLVADDAPIVPTEPGRLRLRGLRTIGGPDSAAPDLDFAAGVDVVPAVAAAFADRIDATAAIGCPLMAPAGTPVGWLVALSGEPCAARLREILEAVAWVFTLALRHGWEPWRTQPAAIALTPEERSMCREAREAIRAQAAQAAAPEAAGAGGDRSHAVDENVQFTVYRPRRIPPETWRPVLAFAHLAERRADAPADAPDPLEEVRRQAKQILGADADAYADVTADSGEAIPREGEITFVLDLPGMTVNPPQRSFRWVEDVQREEFRVKAPAALDGSTVRGVLRVHLGALLVAEVRLAIQVDAAAHGPSPVETDAEQARPYRRIFPSYSHRDEEIVRQVEAYARTMGDEYLRDVTTLRAGEQWNDRLLELVRTADVFQLFWSRNSMRSPWVRQEWEYALSLGRPHFVRPTYWELPLPEAPDQDLPPASLRALHFQRLPVRVEAEPAVARPPAPPAPPPPALRPAPAPRPQDEHPRAGASSPRRRRRFPAALVALLLVGFVGGSVMWNVQRGTAPPAPATNPGDPGGAGGGLARIEATSPDGTLLASMDAGGRLRIASRAGGEPVVIATAFRPPDIVSMRFSDDGTRVLCTLRSGETVAWDARTGARVAIG